MSRFWFLIVLNAPILAEVTRKYFIPNDFVFLTADIAAIVTLGVAALSGSLRTLRIPPMFFALSGGFIFWTLVLQMFSASNFGIYAVGIRANYMPLVYLLISAQFVRSQPNAIRYFFASATFWIILAALMAAAQIALGKDHPINGVWGHQGVGIGDYAKEKGELIDKTLFRPTSIFMHTGKFGQVAFLLVLFRLCYTLFSGEKISKLLLPLFTFDVVALFISGQRGAFLFIAFSLAVLMLLGAKGGRRTGMQMAIFALLSIVIAGSLITLFPQYGSAFSERFYSAIVAIPRRLEGNLIEPFETILSDFFILGRGFGYYTFGAKEFGGTIVYQDTYLTLAGYGESSIVRMCLEAGFLATLINTGAFIAIYRRALSAYQTFGRSLSGVSIIFYLLWIASLVMWSNTADVFGNSVPMFYGYALSGAILLSKRKLTPASSKGRNLFFSPPEIVRPIQARLD
jgi:hypothetical protein